jgi:ribosomal protein S3AE
LDVEGVPPDFNKVDAEVCVTGEDGFVLRIHCVCVLPCVCQM